MLNIGLQTLLKKHTFTQKFSKQALWELHEIEKNITRKINALSLKCYSRIPCH